MQQEISQWDRSIYNMNKVFGHLVIRLSTAVVHPSLSPLHLWAVHRAKSIACPTLRWACSSFTRQVVLVVGCSMNIVSHWRKGLAHEAIDQ